MLVRQVVIPVNADQLWSALTDPDSVSVWFGSRVEWEVRPGGLARFLDDDGTVRGGVIDAVQPGRHLSFRWWPEEGDESDASQVSYDLDPDGDSTRLTVTEQPTATAPSAVSARAGTPSAVGPWTGWDSRLFRCWAQAVPGAPVGRVAR